MVASISSVGDAKPVGSKGMPPVAKPQKPRCEHVSHPAWVRSRSS